MGDTGCQRCSKDAHLTVLPRMRQAAYSRVKLSVLAIMGAAVTRPSLLLDDFLACRKAPS